MKDDITVRFFDDSQLTVTASTPGSYINFLDSLIAGFNTTSVSTMTVSNNICTVTVSTGHGINEYCTGSGAVINISGVSTPLALNGDWRAYATSATQLWFRTEGISDQSATGTISVKYAGLQLTKVFSDTNKAAYQFTDTLASGIFLYVDDTNASYVYTYGAEDMTDINTMINATSSKSILRNTFSNGWYVISDNKYMTFASGYNGWNNAYDYGDIDRLTSLDVYCGVFNNYIVRSYTQTGAFTLFNSYNMFPSLATNYMYPNFDTNSYYSKVIIVQGTAIRGYAPGQIIHGNYTSNFSIRTHKSYFTLDNYPNTKWMVLNSNVIGRAWNISSAWRTI